MIRWGAAAVFVLVATSSVATAQGVGLSYLGICNKTWPCQKSLSAYKGHPVIRTGWLEQSFGSSCPCADAILADRRPKEVRIHVANGPCMRNRRCGRHEVFSGFTVSGAHRDLKRATSRIVGRMGAILERIRARLEKSRGGVTCYLSPVLESDLNEEARLLLHRLAGAYLPQCTLVDSPHRDRCLSGFVCEKHGDKPNLRAPCISDLDGISARDVDAAQFLARTRSCDLRFVWAHGFNCNGSGSSWAGDPIKRDCKRAGPDIEALSRWLHRTYR